MICTLLVACGSKGNGPDSGGSNAIRVVAAENFYGDVVRQLGGGRVNVTSILSDPNADPHEYESSTDNAKAISTARLVILNGIGYDGFMDKLLAASPNKERTVINVGELLGKKAGDNPHVWYDIESMSQLVDKISAALERIDPAGQGDFADRNQRFKASLQPIANRIAAIKSKYAGTHLTQTEPVFGYMGEALGLELDDGEFQHAIEEGTDPSSKAVAQINAEISNHEIKALLYNSQTASPVTNNVKDLAKKSGVPIVGVSETEPPNSTYQLWMLAQLDALQKALDG